VIGSKNRPGEYRRLLGSVAERVVHMAEHPVTVVKTPIEAWRRQSGAARAPDRDLTRTAAGA